MSTVRWTKTQRKKLHGFRKQHKANPTGFSLSAQEAWSWLKTRYETLTPLTEFTVQAPQKSLLATVRESYRSSEPPTALVPEQELMRMAIAVLQYTSKQTTDEALRALCGLWVDVEGVGFAVSMYEQIASYSVDGLYSIDSCELWFRPGIVDPYGYTIDDIEQHLQQETYDSRIRLRGTYFEWSYWPELRRKIYSLDQETFEEGLEATLPIRRHFKNSKEKDAFQICNHLAFAFARDGVWAEEDAHVELDSFGKRWCQASEGHLLLVSLTDPKLAMKLTERYGSFYASRITPYAYDLVEALDVEAIPILELLLDTPQLASRDKRPLNSALKLARTGLP